MVLLGLCWIYRSPWGGLTFSDTESLNEWHSVHTHLFRCHWESGGSDLRCSWLRTRWAPRGQRKGGLAGTHVGRVMLPARGELWQGHCPCEGYGFPECASPGVWLGLRSWASLGRASPWMWLLPWRSTVLGLGHGVCVSSQRLIECSVPARALATQVKPHTFQSWRGRPGEGAVFVVWNDSCPRGLETGPNSLFSLENVHQGTHRLRGRPWTWWGRGVTIEAGWCGPHAGRGSQLEVGREKGENN